jgi:hypothetical protein
MKRRRMSKYGDAGELDNELSYTIAVMVLYWTKERGRVLDNSRDPNRPSACDEVSAQLERFRESEVPRWNADDVPAILAIAAEQHAHLPAAERERKLARLRDDLAGRPLGVWACALKVSPARARKCYSHWFGRARRRSLS